MRILDDVELESLMTEHEVAEQLAIKVATLRKWRVTGNGPTFIKLGSAVRYLPSDVELFLEEGRKKGEAQHTRRVS